MRNEKTSGLASSSKATSWLKPIETCGLILDKDGFEKLEHLSKFSEEIGVKPDAISVLLYTPKKTVIPGFQGVQLTSRGFNWLGKIKAKDVNDFLSRRFDIVICYQNGPDKVIDKLISSSKAEFKIGRLEGSTRVYDLAIGTSFAEIEVFTEEVKKYLRILNRLY